MGLTQFPVAPALEQRPPFGVAPPLEHEAPDPPDNPPVRPVAQGLQAWPSRRRAAYSVASDPPLERSRFSHRSAGRALPALRYRLLQAEDVGYV